MVRIGLYSLLIVTIFMVSILWGCDKKGGNNSTPPPITPATQVVGYNLLSNICGIWNGGVTSTTALGSYPEWIVDFRPISSGQVSAKNELDTANSIFMSSF